MKDFFKMVGASCLGFVLANVVVIILSMLILGAMIGGITDLIKSNKTKTEVSLSSGSVLLLDPIGEIADTSADDAFTSIRSLGGDNSKKSYTLPEIVGAIEEARSNAKVDAIVLRLDKCFMSFDTAQAIRDALLRFKEGGKPIYAYGKAFTLGNYYISSVADKVYAGPEAMIALSGLSSQIPFYTGLLQKLGVKFQIFKVGTFKSAVEPYMLDHMSEANRLQTQTFLDGLWQGTVSEMAASRGIDESVFHRYADEGLFMSRIDTALVYGLVDSLVYETDLEQVLASKIYDDEDADELEEVRADLVLKARKPVKSVNKIAVVYAEGNIVDGRPASDNPFATQSKLIDQRIADKLHELADDDDINAVVLRVNSGGGSASQSELICREVIRLKEQKPIVVSMGGMAASGGYYISSNASEIIAGPYTLTGSIGIFGMFPTFKGTADKLALTFDTVKTNNMSDFGDPMREMRPEEQALMQKYVEEGYDQFLIRVSEGREMTKAQVDSIGQGRVWLGQDALRLGLVDKLGTLETAIQEAARLAELDDYKVVDMVEKEDFWESLFGTSLETRLRMMTASREDRLMEYAARMLESQMGVRAQVPYELQEGLWMSKPRESSLVPALLR